MRKAATSLYFLKNQLQIEIMIETVIVVVIIEGSLEMIEEEEVVMIEEVIATIMIVEETVTIMIELMIMNKRKSKTMEKVQRKLSLLRKTKLPQRNFCLHFRLVNQNHQGKIAMWYHSKFDVLQ